MGGVFTFSGRSDQWIRQLVFEGSGQFAQIFESCSCTFSWTTEMGCSMSSSKKLSCCVGVKSTNQSSTWPLVGHMAGGTQTQFVDRVDCLVHFQSRCRNKPVRNKHKSDYLNVIMRKKCGVSKFSFHFSDILWKHIFHAWQVNVSDVTTHRFRIYCWTWTECLHIKMFIRKSFSLLLSRNWIFYEHSSINSPLMTSLGPIHTAISMTTLFSHRGWV